MQNTKHETCCYCGWSQDLTRDHLIPVSIANTSRHFEMKDIVTACRSCNCTLGDVPIITVPERARWLYSRFKKKYAKLLASPDWTESELDELGIGLRTSIENQMLEKQVLLFRMENLLRVANN